MCVWGGGGIWEKCFKIFINRKAILKTVFKWVPIFFLIFFQNILLVSTIFGRHSTFILFYCFR